VGLVNTGVDCSDLPPPAQDPPGGEGKKAARRVDLAKEARAVAVGQGEKGRRRVQERGREVAVTGERAVGHAVMKKGERIARIP
jgi:hypothetical protein